MRNYCAELDHDVMGQIKALTSTKQREGKPRERSACTKCMYSDVSSFISEVNYHTSETYNTVLHCARRHSFSHKRLGKAVLML